MFKLFKRRHVWLPTWPTALAGLAAGAALAAWLFFSSHSFLAVTDPSPGAKTLVVESWVADNAMGEVAALLNAPASRYGSVWLTGPVFESGSYAFEKFETFSQMGEATLRALGVDGAKIHVVPAERHHRHRTYHAARLLRQAFERGPGIPAAFDLATVDVHARRSRAVYRKVFEGAAEVGVIALPPSSFDPADWYKTSTGVKTTIFEIVALAYETLADGGR